MVGFCFSDILFNIGRYFCFSVSIAEDAVEVKSKVYLMSPSNTAKCYMTTITAFLKSSKVTLRIVKEVYLLFLTYTIL